MFSKKGSITMTREGGVLKLEVSKGTYNTAPTPSPEEMLVHHTCFAKKKMKNTMQAFGSKLRITMDCSNQKKHIRNPNK